MRQIWLSLLVLFTLTVILLFFGGYLTGMEHRETQHPYSREVHVTGSRYGFEQDQYLPNTMTDFYHNVLRQPRDDNFQPGRDSYRIKPWFGGYEKDEGEVAPVMFLDPVQQRVFLESVVPGRKAQLAVIHSLFTPRRRPTEPNADAYNKQLAQQERDRVTAILSWYQIERKNTSVFPEQWWREHAKVFGLTPEGDPIPAAVISVKKSAVNVASPTKPRGL
jgi:hypothetical protein